MENSYFDTNSSQISISCLLRRALQDAISFLGSVSRKPRKEFRARKASFRSSVSKNGEVYTPGNSCMKETSLHVQNT